MDAGKDGSTTIVSAKVTSKGHHIAVTEQILGYIEILRTEGTIQSSLVLNMKTLIMFSSI